MTGKMVRSADDVPTPSPTPRSMRAASRTGRDPLTAASGVTIVIRLHATTPKDRIWRPPYLSERYPDGSWTRLKTAGEGGKPDSQPVSQSVGQHAHRAQGAASQDGRNRNRNRNGNHRRAPVHMTGQEPLPHRV